MAVMPFAQEGATRKHNLNACKICEIGWICEVRLINVDCEYLDKFSLDIDNVYVGLSTILLIPYRAMLTFRAVEKVGGFPDLLATNIVKRTGGVV